MKGDENFRESSKSHIQFSNENYIYDTVIPAFKKFLKSSSINLDDLIPRVYFSATGSFPKLSEFSETILAVENISPDGYRNGPRLHLDMDHMLLITKAIAQYHSVTYAMRIKKDPQLIDLIKGLTPFPFKEANGATNFYDIASGVGMERIIEFLDKQTIEDEFFKDFNNLKKFQKNPTTLLQKFLENDEIFSLILHGDYNRNNVLFKYPSPIGFLNPTSVKMIDFQLVRYGTPAIDLSFFYYLNMDPGVREANWMDLLKYYHTNLINSLSDILQCNPDNDMLIDYSFERFNNHFSRFAMYGIMIIIQFLPWMDCTQEECQKLTELYENDMESIEFWEYAKIIGGDSSNLKILDALKHASKMGYMKILE